MISDMFDFRFRKLVTPDLVRAVYGFWVWLTSVLLFALLVGTLINVIRSVFQTDESNLELAVAAIVGGMALYVLGLLVVRIALEAVLVLFRIEENTRASRSVPEPPHGEHSRLVPEQIPLQARRIALGVVIVLAVIALVVVGVDRLIGIGLSEEEQRRRDAVCQRVANADESNQHFQRLKERYGC